MTKLSKYIQMIPTLAIQENPRQESIEFLPKPTQQKFVLLFDIDYCLYYDEQCKKAEKENNMMIENELINEWLEANKSSDLKPKTKQDLKREYGSSREGMFNFYGKPMDYVINQDFNKVHHYISRNDELIEEIEKIPYTKYCFTNGFPHKASLILNKLEIEEYFSAVFCSIDDYEKHRKWILKPNPEAYRFVINQLSLDKDTKIVFFDDSKENIQMAQSEEFQWIAYHVTPENDIVARLRQFRSEHMDNEENSSLESLVTENLLELTAVSAPLQV